MLGFGGIVSFTIGALMLIDTDVPGYGIPWPVIASLALGGGLLVAGVSSVALRARRRPVVTGAEAMVGSIGEVLDDGLLADQPHGAAGAAPSAAGWRVRGSAGAWPAARRLPPAAARVTGRHGLLLTVAPLYDVPGQEPHRERHQGEPS